MSSSHVLMVRPAVFGFNYDTASTNAFQSSAHPVSLSRIVRLFDTLVDLLRKNGLEVWVHQDTPVPPKPDALFPNNWLSTHTSGELVLYPLFHHSRAVEVQPALVQEIVRKLQYTKVVDMRPIALPGEALEGTESLVLDAKNRVVYAAVSPRTHTMLVNYWAEQLGYEPVVFHTADRLGQPIYYTNVVMHIGSGYAVVCLEALCSDRERTLVEQKLKATGHKVIPISLRQMEQFAGNMLETVSVQGDILLIASNTAWQVLDYLQQKALQNYARPVLANIPDIERIEGGSVRCMLAELNRCPTQTGLAQ